jgi:ubiquinone/menaquinone biosynthesis C-methylase UbiE
MLRQAQRHGQHVHQEFTLCQSQSQAMPFSADSFDTVVVTFPSAYICDQSTWDEFIRLLAPGGRVVIVYGARIGRRSPIRCLFQGLLSLGQVRGRAFHPEVAGLSVQHRRVLEGPDQVDLLVAERATEFSGSL